MLGPQSPIPFKLPQPWRRFPVQAGAGRRAPSCWGRWLATAQYLPVPPARGGGDGGSCLPGDIVDSSGEAAVGSGYPKLGWAKSWFWIWDFAEHFDCSHRSRLGLCCWPVPLRARWNIREARGEALTPLFKPAAGQGGMLTLALRGCKHPNWGCVPVLSVETRASFQQAVTNAAALLGMPMPSGEERSAHAHTGGMRMVLVGAWSLVNVVGEGENLTTSGKMQWNYTKYVWCGAQKKQVLLHKRP